MGKAPEFTKLIDLAAEKLGGKVLECSDDFFASKDNLIKPGRGVFVPDKYTENGKWMDGWESRRKRSSGHDWCIIKLATPGIIKGFDIDTNHFLGNHPPFASVEACILEENEHFQNAEWTEILTKSPLNPGEQHFFEINNGGKWTHVRLNIYPDGGVARCRVYGEVQKNWNLIKDNELVDLAAAFNGGIAVLCNDMFFSHMQNLLMPGAGENMGDGWETKRNRNPGNVDWVVIKLAHEGTIKKAVIDTAYFKGNYPDSCSLEACSTDSDDFEHADWEELLPKTKLEANKEHIFEKELNDCSSFTHIKMNIYPDGGVSRLRLFGYLKK